MFEFYFRFRFFTFASPSAYHSASDYQISSKSDHPRQSYDVISIFQDGDNGMLDLVSFFVISGRSKSTCRPCFGDITQMTHDGVCDVLIWWLDMRVYAKKIMLSVHWDKIYRYLY